MSEQIQTLRGAWKRRTHILGLPEHPIERTKIYKDYIASRNASDSARHCLTRILRACAPCALGLLTTTAVNHAVQKLLADGYKPSSVDQDKKMLGAFLTYAQINGEIRENPAKGADKIDLRQEKKEIITVPDFVRNKLDEYYMSGEATAEDRFLWASIRGGHRISEAAMAIAGDIVLTPTLKGIEPYVWLGTKRRKRKVDYPDWSMPVLIAMMEAATGEVERPLLYLKGIPVSFEKGKETIRYRAKLARDKFYAVQTKLFGKPIANPHAFRSDFITRVLMVSKDPLIIDKLAMRCGHSPEQLRKDYWQFVCGSLDGKLANI